MERRYDIDWLRVIAIGLLLIYHIAIVFQPWAMFLGFIKSDELIEGLWKIMSILNVWRIPFLFFVSGMGVYFAIRKRSWKQLLMERSKRILLPLVFGTIVIVPLQFYLFQSYYMLPFSYSSHPAHLWFLGNIFSYVVILSPIFFYLKRSEGKVFQQKLSKFLGNPMGVLSISSVFVLEAVLVKPPVFELYAMSWHGFFLGFLAFFCGFLFVYSGKSFWNTVLKWRWLYLSLAIGLYLVRVMVFNLKSPNYLMAIESNTWIFFIFGFGFNYLNKPNKSLTYLSQAAYPVYIIHMFVLFLASIAVLPLSIPVVLKFILIIALTLLGCFFIYELIIRRIGVLRPLFGLQWNGIKLKRISVKEKGLQKSV